MMLLKHEQQVFIDQTIAVAGNAFIKCNFSRCTILLDYFSPSHLEDCTFDSCIWHLTARISDQSQVPELLEMLTKIVGPSLPRSNQP